MVNRLIKFNKNSSLLLFGARGTGKTTFIREEILIHLEQSSYWYFDLLQEETEDRFLRSADSLEDEFKSSRKKPNYIIIDEIQKVPKLLDIAHRMIELYKVKFILTGSSARKLKLNSANLLAGRALSERLFPLTSFELKKTFNLEMVLNYGSLPQAIFAESDLLRHQYLRSYVLSYVKLEIQQEQLLRKLDPFRDFLEIAAQMNGKIINASKISKEIGVDDKTIHSYYEILSDTYLGFYLPSFHLSIRKSQKKSPKFFLFDPGVKRALERSLNSPVVEGTSYYGDTFEHWVICEIYRLNEYTQADYRISYFETSSGGEIDVVLSRGMSQVILIEIKSTTHIDESEVKKLASYKQEFTHCSAFYLSRDPRPKNIQDVSCRHWQSGLEEIFYGHEL